MRRARVSSAKAAMASVYLTTFESRARVRASRAAITPLSGRTTRSGTMPPPPRITRPASERYTRWASDVSRAAADSSSSGSRASATASAAARPLGVRWMLRPLGVNQRAVVSFSTTSLPGWLDSRYTDCTRPLP